MEVYTTLTIFCLVYLTCAAPLSTKDELSLSKLECEVLSTTRKVDGFVPFTATRTFCSDVTPSMFYNVTCDQRCRDPVKNKILSKKYYKSEPVVQVMTFVTRSGKTFSERLSVSCRCIATKKGLKKSKKAKRGRGDKKGYARRRH